MLAYLLIGLMSLDALIASQRDRWRRCSVDDYREKIRTCHSRQRDLIVVGGSPVSEGIDPDHFVGMNWQGRPIEHVYAMGLPGATTTEIWHAVLHGTRKPPRVLVYGISASDMNGARNEPHGPASLMTWRDLTVWWQLRPDSREWVTRHFLQSRLANAWQVYRYRHGLRLWLADAINDCLPGSAEAAASEASA
ncbi:MAG: hypothetical protein K8T89_06015, partial [Planctomycetes bacterium]|nr:hypothetical protein [Planctomycetota bacterium]